MLNIDHTSPGEHLERPKSNGILLGTSYGVVKTELENIYPFVSIGANRQTEGQTDNKTSP